MRTLRITLLASLAGWAAGIVAGTVGGFVLTLLVFGPRAILQMLTLEGFILSELRWALAVAVAIFPGSLFVVAPLVFRALGRASFWHPFEAACAGGGIGVAALVPWFMVVSLFGTPINWSRPGEGVHMVSLCVCTALLIGATIGCVAVLAARSYLRMMPAAPSSASHDLPPPVPYEY